MGKELKGYEWGKKKESHNVPREVIQKEIEKNPIYSEAIRHYENQIGYGIAKYPETLNRETWDLQETLAHEISEIVDQLNYKVMLKQKVDIIRILVEHQGADGTWNYNDYMRGVYNGMEMVLSMIENRKPTYKEKPESWLCDKEGEKHE